MLIYSEEEIEFHKADSKDLIIQALHLRHDVYLRVGYIKEAYPDRIIPDYADEISDYILAVNAFGEVIGTIRLAPPNPNFKVFNDWAEFLYPDASQKIQMVNGTRSVELGALAVKKCEHKKIAWGLYKATYYYSQQNKIFYWVIAMDNIALRSLERLGWYVEKIGYPMEYMGSITSLGVMPVELQLQNIQAKNEGYHNYIKSL
jgi:N-acyl-L-homoserine lactone synthetase